MQRVLVILIGSVLIACLLAEVKAEGPAFYNDRGVAWERKGEHDKALADFNHAITLDPDDEVAYMNRGSVWDEKGDYEKALADYNEAIRLNPEYADAYYNRAITWRNKGEYAKAIADWHDAMRLDPDDADIYSSLAWLRASCPDAKYRDGQAALSYARKAHEMSRGKNWAVMDTLAAAYAENGSFDRAAEWESKALAMAEIDKSAKAQDIKDARSRLELYKQKKPYRQEPKNKPAPTRSPAGMKRLGSRMMVDECGTIWLNGKAVGIWGVDVEAMPAR